MFYIFFEQAVCSSIITEHTPMLNYIIEFKRFVFEMLANVGFFHSRNKKDSEVKVIEDGDKIERM